MAEGSRAKTDKVAVCIATCGRPESLNRLLESLSKLKLNKNTNVELCIVIVDNHPEVQGQSVAAAWSGRMPFPIHYGVEATPGVASARNTLVRMASDCDFIAFIDDDETASEDWVDELLEAQKKYAADVIQGATRSLYEDPPAWLSEGKFFEMKRYSSGQPLTEAYTFNVLVSQRALSWVEGPFDERLNLTGGEDVFLFRQLFRKGARIFFTDRAVTEEIRPRSRTTLKWYCQRAYRIGNTNVIVDRYFNPSLGWLLKWSGYAIGRFGQAVMFWCKAPLLGRTTAVRGLLALCLGAGNITGLFNHKYYEYRKHFG